MINEKIINTYLVTGGLNSDSMKLNKVTEYYLSKIYERNVSIASLLDLVSKDVINFDMFTRIGANILGNVRDNNECEQAIYYTSESIKMIKRHIRDFTFDNTIRVLDYKLATMPCKDFSAIDKILKRARIIGIHEYSKFYVDDRIINTLDICKKDAGDTCIRIDSVKDYLAVILIKDDKASMFSIDDIKNKLDKFELIGNIIVRDDYDVILLPCDEDDTQALNELVDSKIYM